MATKLTKKQQTQLTEKLTGIIQGDNALQLRMSTDTSVNEMNINQISGELNRIHYRAIGKDLPTVITIPVKQLGSGDPSPDNVRPITGYVIDGLGTVYSGELNIETGVLTVTYGSVDMGTLTWSYQRASSTSKAGFSANAISNNVKPAPSLNTLGNIYCEKYTTARYKQVYDVAVDINNAIALRTNGGLRICDSAYDSAVTFKASLSGVIVVYELETPETYTLTPEQMIQLLDQL